MISMRRTGIVAMALAVALASVGTSAMAKGKHKGGGKHAAVAVAKEKKERGTITAGSQDSITIQTKKHGTLEFKLTGSTTFERRQKKTTVAASVSEATVGMRAVIVAQKKTAEKVTLKKAPKAGKKAKGGKKSKNK